MAFTEAEQRFMRRALALARRGVGKTSPNPAVGAVLVRGGRIIGEGCHQRAGGPHAEIAAFSSARRRGHSPAGATLFVTLEPCSTWGRTPPCTDAIIAAGVKQVVVGTVDPNPRHRGQGLRLLRRAGIRVRWGLLREEATGLNRAFNKWVATGLPLVIAKAALSLDGRFATRTGDSKWITSEAARREAHNLRATVDAIMVGATTVIRDDPQLTVRHAVHGKQPWRVVIDGRGRSPLRARLFRDNLRHRTIVLTTLRSSGKWRRDLALKGVQVLVLSGPDGRMRLRAAFRALGALEITSVLVEGGGDLLAGCFDEKLVDQVAFFYAPQVIAEAGRVAAAQSVRGTWRRVGRDLLFTGDVVR